MKQRGVIQRLFLRYGHYEAGRDVPWWVQCATAGLGSGLSMCERSRKGRARPRSNEACPRFWMLFMLGGDKESVKHMVTLRLNNSEILS